MSLKCKQRERNILWPGFLFPADINLGLIRYVLRQENVQETMDNFKFLVRDSKPNVVSDNVFHIQWSLISFEHKRSAICTQDDSDFTHTKVCI